jgi:CheY-like chemotaxis protein
MSLSACSFPKVELVADHPLQNSVSESRGVAIKVLIVENRKDWQAILRDCIKASLKDVEFETAEDYVNAWIKVNSRDFDLVIVDPMLPDSNEGIMLLNNLYDQGVRLSAFIVSIYSRADITARVPIYYPVQDFYDKTSFDTRHFQAAVATAIEREGRKRHKTTPDKEIYGRKDSIESTEVAYKWDVFISYSHKDEIWVTNVLVPRLEAQGVRVCIDFRDFTPGKPALINVQDATTQSRHTVLVLTPHWIEGEWTLFESLLIRTADPTSLQRCTVPIMLEKCDLPDFISVLTWTDFTRSGREDIAWQSLFRALGVDDATANVGGEASPF